VGGQQGDQFDLVGGVMRRQLQQQGADGLADGGGRAAQPGRAGLGERQDDGDAVHLAEVVHQAQGLVVEVIGLADGRAGGGGLEAEGGRQGAQPQAQVEEIGVARALQAGGTLPQAGRGASRPGAGAAQALVGAGVRVQQGAALLVRQRLGLLTLLGQVGAVGLVTLGDAGLVFVLFVEVTDDAP
jgi:hypothetical protein